jgi:hypothetical protein
MSLELVKTITQSIEGLTLDDVCGMLLLKPDSAFLDEGGFICGFDDRGYIITPYGIYETQEGSHSEQYAYVSWKEWQARGLAPFIRRFSEKQFLIFIGDKKGQAMPGFSFDLRRYQGEQPIEKAYRALSNAFEFLTIHASQGPVSEFAEEESLDQLEDDAEVDDVDPSEEDGATEDIDLRDRSNEYVAHDVAQAATDFFTILEFMHAWGNENGYKVCSRSGLNSEVLNEIYLNSDCVTVDQIKGVVFEYPEGIELDENLVSSFEGRIAAVCDWGVAVISCDSGSYDSEENLYWHDFNRYDLQFYRFGDAGGHSYGLAQKDSVATGPLILDFDDIDCDEIQEDGYSINNTWERGWDIIAALREAHPFDPSSMDDGDEKPDEDDDTNEVADDYVDEHEEEAAVDLLLERAEAAREAGSLFFGLLSLAVQQCSEAQPKSVFVGEEISEEHIAAMHSVIGNAGVGPYAISLDSSQVELSFDGKLTGWKGLATLVSPEGLFHVARDDQGRYALEGKNSFLSWRKFFRDFNAGLQIRDDGPDLWLGTSEKVMARFVYCDYSANIAQWDYFEDFVKADLLKAYEAVKDFY